MMNQGVCNVGTTVPERERYIPNQAARLERVVTELEEEFVNLQGRLNDLRRDETTSPKEAEEKPKELSLTCPLAEHLRMQSNRISNIIERIRYQLTVLEI